MQCRPKWHQSFKSYSDSTLVAAILLIFLSSCSVEEPEVAILELKNLEVTLPSGSTQGTNIGKVVTNSNQANLNYNILSQSPAGAISIDRFGLITIADAKEFDFDNNIFITAEIEVFSSLITKNASVAITVDELDVFDYEVIDYFKDIALGFEFGDATEITRRWEDEMRIFVSGNGSIELLAELDKIIEEINSIVTSGFKIKLVPEQSLSNYHLYLGDHITYGSLYPNTASLAVSNWGLFSLWWNGRNELNFGRMYVDMERANSLEQKHLLREELTQSLGLAKDSREYAESIFQQDFSTKVTDYALIDIELIRLLYHPDMESGLNKQATEQRLRQILLKE